MRPSPAASAERPAGAGGASGPPSLGSRAPAFGVDRTTRLGSPLPLDVPPEGASLLMPVGAWGVPDVAPGSPWP